MVETLVNDARSSLRSRLMLEVLLKRVFPLKGLDKHREFKVTTAGACGAEQSPLLYFGPSLQVYQA